MRFMNKSSVVAVAQTPEMTDDTICLAFDANVRLNETADDSIVSKLSECSGTHAPAGTENSSTANTNNDLKASKMHTMNTDGAIIPKAIQVQPKFVRKTPKFPSRERHMAIRRKKPSPSKTLNDDCFCMRSACRNGDEVDTVTE